MNIRYGVPDDFAAIARMHVDASINGINTAHSGAKYRFYHDKTKLFYGFDSKSTLIAESADGVPSGVLIFTPDEPAFNSYCGPRRTRFYWKALKTACGYYGFDYRKYFHAARSMIGKNDAQVTTSPGLPAEEVYGKIWVLIVLEDFRGQGIASQLIQRCVEDMEGLGHQLRVTVKVDNHPARKAYQKNGFVEIGNCMESAGESLILAHTGAAASS